MRWVDIINRATGGAFARAIAQEVDAEILTGVADHPCPYIRVVDAYHEINPDHCGGDCYREEFVAPVCRRSEHPCPIHGEHERTWPIPVKEVTFTARHWSAALEHAHYLKDADAVRTLLKHGIHERHCRGYETLAWPCPPAAAVVERLLCFECARPRPCPVHDWEPR